MQAIVHYTIYLYMKDAFSASQTSSIVAVKENFLIATFMVYFVF